MLIFTEVNENDIMVMDPDLDFLENDILSDPSIRSQIDVNYKTAYKIPETRIRSMPIEDTNIERKDRVVMRVSVTSGDWLDCASKNSGIPRWVLLSMILSAVLMALWLSFSTEQKEEQSEDGATEKCGSLRQDECCLILNEHVPEKDPAIFEKEVDFSEPPKYTVENQKV